MWREQELATLARNAVAQGDDLAKGGSDFLFGHGTYFYSDKFLKRFLSMLQTIETVAVLIYRILNAKHHYYQSAFEPKTTSLHSSTSITAKEKMHNRSTKTKCLF